MIPIDLESGTSLVIMILMWALENTWSIEAWHMAISDWFSNFGSRCGYWDWCLVLEIGPWNSCYAEQNNTISKPEPWASKDTSDLRVSKCSDFGIWIQTFGLRCLVWHLVTCDWSSTLGSWNDCYAEENNKNSNPKTRPLKGYVGPRSKKEFHPSALISCDWWLALNIWPSVKLFGVW